MGILGYLLLTGWSFAILCSGQFTPGTLLALLALNLAAGLRLWKKQWRGRDLRRITAAAGWWASVALTVDMLDSWTYAVVAPGFAPIYYLATPACLCLALWGLNRSAPCDDVRGRWEGISLFWAALAICVCIGIGYTRNSSLIFFGAWTSLLALIVLSKFRYPFKPLGSQLLNTSILVLAALPLADRLLAPPAPASNTNRPLASANRPPNLPPAVTPQNARQFYNFQEAHGYPKAFDAWWSYFQNEFGTAAEKIYQPAPDRQPPYKLRPNSHAFCMESLISINSHGFRGKEIAEPKGNVYRIIALGESTTFGLTFLKDDKPWPELLQQMIRERLQPGRPVEVINAGIPGYSLATNLRRLEKEILPVHPDMIISYHGYNGFRMIDNGLPEIFGPPPPPYVPRPLRLAAELEYRLKIRGFSLRARRSTPPVAPAEPLKTEYANRYRQLITCCKTNGIKLVLANYCMAINENSSHAAIDFYAGFGSGVLYARSGANTLHTAIVRGLAAENPQICFVDTHQGLEGDLDKYIDIIHFNQDGEQQLAENMFAGIRTTLQEELKLSTNGENAVSH